MNRCRGYNKMRYFKLAVIVILFCLLYPAAGKNYAENKVLYIHFKNGSGIRGLIVYRAKHFFRVRTAYAVIDVYKSTIKDVTPIHPK